MANEELVKPENNDFPYRQDHFTGIRHNYEIFPSRDFEKLLDIDLQIGVSYEANEVWSHFQEHKAIALQEVACLVENQNSSHLSLTDNADSTTSEIDKPTIIESTEASRKQESQENSDVLELEMSQSMEFYQKQDMAPSSPQCWSLRSESHHHEIVVGTEFSDVKACRRALRDAAISLSFEMNTVKSDKTRFTAKCMAKDCPWRIHCSKLPNSPTFTVRTIHGTHTCGGKSHLGHQQASAQWVADFVKDKLKENPRLKPKEILSEIHRVHGIALSYKQAWRGKERVLANLGGPFEEEYRLLPQYCDEIRRSNPGSVALVHTNPIDESFQQLFISFKASISGFLSSCRPLIALDRALLKSKYPVTLLLASGFDGEGDVFPVAFAIVNEENDCNWHWFLSELRKILEADSEYMPKLTVLSTRERSVVDGVEANFPTAYHGFCVHYLAERFRKEFQSSILVSLLWEASHSLTVFEFKSRINKIQQISPEAFLWIQNISPSLWASSYFEGSRFGQLTANVVTDSLSGLIQETSGLPIIQMMECIHLYLMDLFKARREKSLLWSDILLVPSAERQVFDAIEQSRVHRVYRANETEFEVMSHEANVVVDIGNRTCLCRRWKLHGLPCSHAVGALLSCNEDVYKYTESFFTVESYRRAYAESVEPVSEEAYWRERDSERDGIRTPRVTKVVQRRRRRREEDGDRVKRVVHCGRCNQTGHFRTTCTAPM